MHQFPLSAVRLLDSPFLDAQRTDLAYLLALEPDRLLAPYRREAGLPALAEPYPNWESQGLDGHTGGHALSAAALLWAATGDERALTFATAMVDGLRTCQDALGTGYVGGIPHGVELWERIGRGQVSGDSFGLNGAWVPWYNLHKTFAGLIDAARSCPAPLAGRALDAVVRLGDWWLTTSAGLDDVAFEAMLRTEFGGMCEAFADLAALTGREEHLTMARRFADRAVLDPLLAGRDELTGMHANTQIAKVVGYQRVAELTGDVAWAGAARTFWDAVVEHRSLAFGGDSVSEHFHPRDDYSSAVTHREGPESCNTSNMLELTRHLFLADPRPELLEFYERATVNHVLSAQHPDGGFVYFTSARPGHYRVYSQVDQGFWCCVGTGLENYARLGELALTHDGGDLHVLLPVPVRVDWAEREAIVELTSSYPDVSGPSEVALTLHLGAPQAFTVHVRRPGWLADGADLGLQVRGADGVEVDVALDGMRVVAGEHSLAVTRTWSDGDRLTYRLPARAAVDRLPDGSDWAALRFGPVVLVARGGSDDLVGLHADDSRMGHIAAGPLHPLGDAPVLAADRDEDLAAALTAVPGAPMHFTLGGAADRPVILEPFHALHDARYTLYFPTAAADPQAVARRRAALQAADEAALVLATRTVDHVGCGQQQPEVEHDLLGDETWTGTEQGVHWRTARGWFSYKLRDPDARSAVLRVTYRAGTGTSGAASVDVDGAVVAHLDVLADVGGAAVLRTLDVPLDALPRPAGPRRVRVAAHGGAPTPDVVTVSLLTE
ncbi:beta-L-arabinofuranosidase domain-containing protein [Cellulomonas soli]|uniref:beta-L-arabinofuranosidase domain-containing protein n=1 Tax=Cellulomonas soli TaxID=931535 RepID=UPI003F836BF6